MFLLAPLVYVQQLDAFETAKEQQTDSLSLEYLAKKNRVKLNLTRLAFRNIHLQHERVLNKRSALEAELNELGLPFVDETTEVSAQDIKVLLSGPWGGVRAGLSLGFCF